MGEIILETAIGTTVGLTENQVVCSGLEVALDTISANYIRTMDDGYVVVHTPQNILQRLKEVTVLEEYVKAQDYLLAVQIKNDEIAELAKIAAKRSALSPIDMLFEELYRRDKPIQTIREQYNLGTVSELRIGFLFKFLDHFGLTDDYFKENIREALQGRAYDEDSVLQAMRTAFDLGEPEQVAAPQMPEPNDISPILQELDIVVEAAYRGMSLDERVLTPSAWESAGVDPHVVFDKVNKSVRALSKDYLLVQSLGITDDRAGTLKLLQVITNPPSELRSKYFRRPVQIADDAFAMGKVLFWMLEKHTSTLQSEEFTHARGDIYGAVFERLLGKSSLTINLYNPVYDNEEAIYAARLKHQHAAGELADVIINGFVKTYGEGAVSLTQTVGRLVEIARELVHAIPEDVFRLRTADYFVNISIPTFEARIRGMQEQGIPLSTEGHAHWQKFKALGASYGAEAHSIRARLSKAILRPGEKFSFSLNASDVAARLAIYGLADRQSSSVL